MSISLLGRLLLTTLLVGLSVRSEAVPSVPTDYQVDQYLTGVGAATGIAVAPDGALWVADYNGRILRSTGPGSFSVVVSGTPYFEGVAFTASGRAFTAVAGSANTVYEIANGALQPLATGFSAITSIAAKGNDLYVTNSGNGTISRISLSGTVTTVLTGIGNPFGVSFDSAGTMYFIDHAGGAVYSYDFANPPVRIATVSPLGGTYTGTGFNGRLFFTNVLTGSLNWLPTAGAPSVFATGFVGKATPPAIGPQGIAFNGQNVLYVADGDKVWRIVGPGPTVLPGYQIDQYLTGVGATTGVTIAPDGALWVADYQGGRLLRSTSRNAFTVASSGIPYVEGVAFTASGRIFAASSTGPSSTIYEIVNGVAQPFATGFSYPTSIAAKGDELFVSNSGNGTISKVSMAGVVQPVLAGVGNPFGVSFDAAGKLFFIDSAGGAVYSYDFAGSPVGVSSVTPYGGTFTGQGFGGRLFFTDTGAGSLYWLPDGSSRVVFGTGFAGKTSPPAIGPQGIAFDGQNALYVGDGNAVWRITTLAPTASLSVDSVRRTVGESIVLTWSSTGATSCTASGGAAGDGWAGDKAPSGSATITESSATTYTYVLVCASAAGSASAQVSVTFTVPVVSLVANRTSLTAGQLATLEWTSTDATSCSATGGAPNDGWAGPKATSGSASLTSTTAGTFNYSITCIAGAQTTQATVSVTYTSPAVSLVANPTTLTAGDVTRLTWTSTNATSCIATGGSPNDGWAGPKAANGNVSLTATNAGTYAYTIACESGSQTSQAQVSITYTVPSVSLLAAPTNVTVGQSATLTWTSSNATSCAASGGSAGDGWAGSKALAGTAAVSFGAAGTFTYTLVCNSGTRSTQAQATVSVATAPSVPSGGGGGGGGGGAAGPLALLLLAAGATRRRPQRSA